MHGATIEELRELSRRSRRTLRVGALALVAALLLFPAQLVLATWIGGAWLAPVSLAVGGALVVHFAFIAGQERGAFRRVFRRIAEEKRTRTLVPQASPSVVVVEN